MSKKFLKEGLFLYFNGIEIRTPFETSECSVIKNNEIFKENNEIESEEIFYFEEPSPYVNQLGCLDDICKNLAAHILKSNKEINNNSEYKKELYEEKTKIILDFLMTFYKKVLFYSNDNLLFNLQANIKKYLIQKFNDEKILTDIIQAYKNDFDKNKYYNVEDLSQFSINEVKEKLLNSIDDGLDPENNHNFYDFDVYLSDHKKEFSTSIMSPDGLLCDMFLNFKNLNVIVNVNFSLTKIDLLSNFLKENLDIDINIDVSKFIFKIINNEGTCDFLLF